MLKKILLTIFYLAIFVLVLNINLEIFSFGTHAHAASWITQNLVEKGSSEPWIFGLWKFSLNLINIILVFVLIFLGFVNILHINYDTYQIKKYLLPLIISVVLANFSLFICRAIMELAGALSMTFFKQAQYKQIYMDIMNGIQLNFNDVSSWVAQISGLLSATLDFGVLIINTIVGAILSVLLVVVFLFLSAVLYVRVYVIYILAAISPLAYVFMVLPNTQGLFRQWWSWFLKFVFMGPVIALLVKVAAVIGGAGSFSTLGSIAVLIAVIALLVIAAMTPWILGMNKITAPIINGAKQAAGAGWKTLGLTKPGRTLQGMIQAVPERIKENAALDVAAAEGGAKRAIDTGLSGFVKGDWGREYADEKARILGDESLKRLPPARNKEEFMDSLTKPTYRNLSAYAKEQHLRNGADKGWYDEGNIDKLIDVIGSDKTLNKNPDLLNGIIKDNNEARIAKRATPIDLDKTKLTGAQKIDIAANDLSNHDSLINRAGNDPNLRNRIRANTLNSIQTAYTEWGKDPTKYKDELDKAKKVFTSISSDIENNIDGSSSLKNTTYNDLYNDSNLSNMHVIKKFISDNNVGDKSLQRANSASEYLAKQTNLNAISDVNIKRAQMEKMLIGRHELHEKMKSNGIDPKKDQTKIEAFIGDKDAYQTFIHNEDQVAGNDIYSDSILSDLKSRGIIK